MTSGTALVVMSDSALMLNQVLQSGLTKVTTPQRATVVTSAVDHVKPPGRCLSWMMAPLLVAHREDQGSASRASRCGDSEGSPERRDALPADLLSVAALGCRSRGSCPAA